MDTLLRREPREVRNEILTLVGYGYHAPEILCCGRELVRRTELDGRSFDVLQEHRRICGSEIQLVVVDLPARRNVSRYMVRTCLEAELKALV